MRTTNRAPCKAVARHTSVLENLQARSTSAVKGKINKTRTTTQARKSDQDASSSGGEAEEDPYLAASLQDSAQGATELYDLTPRQALLPAAAGTSPLER